MKARVSGVPYSVDLPHNLKALLTFAAGAVFGLLAVLATQRLFMESPQLPTIQKLPAIQIIESYNAGIEDALKTNPASWRLEETCLEIWANKQPTQ